MGKNDIFISIILVQHPANDSDGSKTLVGLAVVIVVASLLGEGGSGYYQTFKRVSFPPQLQIF
jgi:hypothetical protein